MSALRLLVAGGGPVGLAFACACEGADVRVVESTATAAEPARPFDVRVYALSPGTRRWLAELGAWERLDPDRIAPVHRMDVFGDRGARLQFSDRASGPVAYIVEAGRLGAALESAAATRTGITLLRGAGAAEFRAEAHGAWMGLENGTRLEGDLLVGADGPDSRVRASFGIEAEEHPYHEAAVVANFETEKPHEDVARQWFRDDGVLAWLPLPGARISIVWSTASGNAATLTALAERDLEARVRDAGGAILGDLRLISPVARFALRLVRVRCPVVPGVALIGDAAHTVHPLAGQGVNLGFQDAAELARVLAGRSPLERAGDLRLLRRYSRARREDVAAMQFVTDRLDRLFATRARGVAALRNLGLGLVDRQPWVKRALIARAMR